MNLFSRLVPASLLLLTAGGAAADPYPDPDRYDWSGIAVGVKAGTLGIGPEVTAHIRPWINLRGSFNLLDWNTTYDIDDIEYDATFDYTSALALVDLMPYSGRGFRISIGAAYLDGGIDLTETPLGPVRLGNNVYTPDEVGRIRSSFSADSIAPYLGIGFGNPVRPDRAWTFMIDLGVVFQGADVTIAADSPLAGDPTFEDDLEIERTKIEDDLDQWKLYPVVTFTIAYHF